MISSFELPVMKLYVQYSEGQISDTFEVLQQLHIKLNLLIKSYLQSMLFK